MIDFAKNFTNFALNNFDTNEALLMCNIQQAENAILTLQNIGLAQAALDRTYYARINTQLYF